MGTTNVSPLVIQMAVENEIKRTQKTLAKKDKKEKKLLKTLERLRRERLLLGVVIKE